MDTLSRALNETIEYDYLDCEKAFREAGVLSKVTDNKKVTYYNAAASFDIEATSFKVVQSTGQEDKRAIMYIWKLCIEGVIISGRTWDAFLYVINKMVEWYNLSPEKRFVLYVHNLGYEFQYIRKWFDWVEVFSLEKREPIRALTADGIEFRCSYKLSGYSLVKLSDHLIKYKVKKLVGDLDYSLIRNSKTKLTEKENQYCVNDVLVVVAYIKEYIEREQYIYNIPMTKTGVVRNYSRNYCFYAGGKKKENQAVFKEYRTLMKSLVFTPDDYIILKRAFSGGFTHSNPLYTRQIVKNVNSFDFTSSYPYVMISEKFPMTAPMTVQISSSSQLDKLLNNCCCCFDVQFEGLRSKVLFENYISESHCRQLRGQIVNNGRVVQADNLITTVTEQDFFIIKEMYEWDKMTIYNFRYMYKGYLPKNFVRAILELYGKKTQLKGVVGSELEYLLSKEMVNSMYGMTVTDICRDEISYTDNIWSNNKPDIEEAIKKNNKSVKRFLYYPWGVWVTAYARRNLFTAIMELQDDYIYSDTDSVKFINYEAHKKYFEKYNAEVLEKLKKAMRYHRLDIELTRPKNIKGEEKQIGIWDYEGIYSRFKTIGAKRYMVEKDGKINITVAGLNKGTTVPFLLDKFGDKIFENFDDELYIPPDYTGKNCHTYIDEEYSGIITDYQGNTAEYYEKSGIYIDKTDYSLSLADNFIKYLQGVQDGFE